MNITKRFIGFLACLSPFLLEGKAMAWRGRGYDGWTAWPCGLIGGWGWGWPGMILGIMFWILVCMAVFYLIRWLIHNTKGYRAPAVTGPGPMDILRERYARGEITGEEFHRVRKDLQ